MTQWRGDGLSDGGMLGGVVEARERSLLQPVVAHCVLKGKWAAGNGVAGVHLKASRTASMAGQKKPQMR